VMGFARLHGVPHAALMLLPLFFILSLALLRVRENRTAELLPASCLKWMCILKRWFLVTPTSPTRSKAPISHPTLRIV